MLTQIIHRKNTGRNQSTYLSQVIFILTILPEVPCFLEWISGASWQPLPVLVLFWPLVASGSHFLTQELLICSVIIVSKSLRMDLLSGWLTIVDLSPNSLCFPHSPSFVLSLVFQTMSFSNYVIFCHHNTFIQVSLKMWFSEKVVLFLNWRKERDF